MDINVNCIISILLSFTQDHKLSCSTRIMKIAALFREIHLLM